jgi:hypothetical protein
LYITFSIDDLFLHLLFRRVFIRNNVVIKVFTEGDISSRIVKTENEIDSLLLKQKDLRSKDDILPRVIIDSNNLRKILEL